MYLDMHIPPLALIDQLDQYTQSSPDVSSAAWVTRELKLKIQNVGQTHARDLTLYGVTPSLQDTVLDQYWKVPP